MGLAARELCWDGATVTNVTADCLHETAVRRKENVDKGASRWAERIRNSDPRTGSIETIYPVKLLDESIADLSTRVSRAECKPLASIGP